MSRPERVDADGADLAGALHEVSNALTVVLGWLGDVRGKVADGPLRDAVEVAYSHAHRGHAVARRAIGGPPPATEAARSSASVMNDARTAVAREADAKGVRVRTKLADIDSSIDAPDAVLQILVNLLLNALAFSPRGSAVTLTSSAQSGHVAFEVRDQGPGLSRDQQSSLFARGQSMRPGGAGIGLSYCHAMAEQHGGKLRLLSSDRDSSDRDSSSRDSSALTANPGAAFELLWPVSEAPSRTSQRVPVAAGLSGLKVLVLEDDEAVLAMVQMGLAARGIEVFPAANLQHARKLCEAGLVDAAFVDLSPIEADPAAALAELRANNRTLPVILISGSANVPSHQLELSAWVRKPFEISELCEALSEVVAR